MLAILLTLKIAEVVYFYSDAGAESSNKIAAFTENLLNKAGFVLKDAQAKGNIRTSQQEVLQTADIVQGMPIYKIDIAEMRQKLNNLPWIKNVDVYRILPSSIKINIVEHKPAGVWINKGKRRVITDEGILLPATAISPDTKYLPLVFGKKGYSHLPEIMDIIKSEPELAERVKALTFVGQRRWNLHFDNAQNGTVVYLPDTNVMHAWKRLKNYEENHKILKRKLTLIDLRLPDKLVVRIENSTKNTVSKGTTNNKKKRRLKLKEQKA